MKGVRAYLSEECVRAILEVAEGVDGGVGRREGVLDPQGLGHLFRYPPLFGF